MYKHELYVDTINRILTGTLSNTGNQLFHAWLLGEKQHELSTLYKGVPLSFVMELYRHEYAVEVVTMQIMRHAGEPFEKAAATAAELLAAHPSQQAVTA